MRILTGLKPTGELHLGNYIGAIRPIIQMEGTKLCLIADYHAMTSNGKVSEQDVLNLAATLMALDYNKELIIYRQSDFPQLHELTWFISCNTSTGVLDRGHAVKAAQVGGNTITNGTLLYPLLMAADILAVKSDAVTVGKDQLQHMEIAKDVARSFNYRHEDLFVVPKAIVMEDKLVLGLDGKKMSKSYNNIIPLMASRKKLKKLVMSIETDSTPMEDPKDPDSCTVMSLYKYFASEEQVRAMEASYRNGGYGYGHAKLELVSLIEDNLGPVRSRYNDLLKYPYKIKRRMFYDGKKVEGEINYTVLSVRTALIQ